MTNPFFERPIVNSPYEYPHRHWELDESGQPTGSLIERRRRAEFITPIPKPKKRKGSPRQEELVLDEGRGLTTKKQAYDLTSALLNGFAREAMTFRATL
jgi:type III restriction enzyme